MIKRTLGCVALFGWLMAGSVSLQAHHSLAGVYDMKKEVDVEGTVTSKVFKSPRVAGSRGQECGWHDNRVGDDTRLGHGPSPERHR